MAELEDAPKRRLCTHVTSSISFSLFDFDVVKKDLISVNICEIEFKTHNEMFDKKALLLLRLISLKTYYY